MIIILDTNFLISIVKDRIADQLKAFRGDLVMTEAVEKELKKPSLGRDASREASAGLELAYKWKVTIYPTNENNVDSSIIELAKELKEADNEIYVATLDNELKGRLKKIKIGTISLRRNKIIAKDEA